MRRGQTGIGGWRNENPRHFRPRIGGNPHFRPLRGYGLLETPRFPPPSSRPIRLQHFNTRFEKPDRITSDFSDKQRYRGNEHHNAYQRPHQQGERPSTQWTRHRNDSRRNISKESSNYYGDSVGDHFHINSMGDIDHRHIPQLRDIYIPPLIPTWETDQTSQLPSGNGHNNLHKQDRDQINKQTSVSIEYTGHRPPASDHYGCNPTSVIDNSHTFSRSVDATVDLVRQRLLNRSDPQNSTDNFENCQNNPIVDNEKNETINDFQNNQSEQPMRKRYQRQPQTEKSNCAKIKNKIVHQIFKMDKEKIHKLMDNPNSSTKFEYAISSLITESQNSFNRHLRSAAEKSLCDSSTEFIQNDNNTIYEDTFMKQMQCILDPQDTVFLEDIKPFVMAELTKVLQLNEYEQHYHSIDDGCVSDRYIEQQNYNPYPTNTFHHEELSSKTNYSGLNDIPQIDYPRSKSVEPTNKSYDVFEDNLSHYEEPKPLYERRHRTQSFNFLQDSTICETPFYGNEMEEKSTGNITRSGVNQGLFDANAEQFSEDEDPFAELDKQYHVAVDHDFIEHDDISSPIPENNVYNSTASIQSQYQNQINDVDIKSFKTEPSSPQKPLKNIDMDIDNQLQDMAKSPLKLSLTSNNDPVCKQEATDQTVYSKQELLDSGNVLPLQEKNENNNNHDSENINKKSESKEKEIDKIDFSTNLKSTSSNSRKRSTDQRPSHRKEKRKKSESCTPESSKQILNKNIIINVNDCASKMSDKCEPSKSIFNLFFSKDESKTVSKDNKNISLNDKNCTEKHSKRKETSKKTTEKDKEKTKRKDSTSSQPTSPTNNNNNNSSSDTSSKIEIKTALKPIDMFNEQPRKISIHQAHRNTAPTPSTTSKSGIDKRNKPKGPLSRQLLKRHVAVQVIRKMHMKQTQTVALKCCGTQLCQAKQKKFASKAVQTDVNIPEKTGNKSNNAFERMKEIDLEIQVLLQEKFKLYSSIETKDTGTNSMQTLGMTVLNVSPYHGDEETETTDDVLSEDTIVNDFANIPVEELEQIAMETVQEHEVGTSNPEKRSRRRKVAYQETVEPQSPIEQRRKKLKAKSPNISLIEQIITDDRPLEDIISLDDLEIPQVKTKNRSRKPKKPNKKKSSGKRRVVKLSNNDFTIRDCSVILVRTDISQYLKPIQTEKPVTQQEKNIIEELNTEISQKGVDIDTSLNVIYDQDESIIEETVVNDIQFDMLDVSEDIIVGDNCEIKSLEDKEEVIATMNVPISEEIILDNSQSSMEDACTPALGQCDECKVYDYSADENLIRDSVVVSGNADAVLAIECVENNFLAACLDGNVYYFSGDGQLITTLRGSNLAVTCLTIVKEKYGTTVYTGSLDSRIRYYDLETGLEKGPECNVLSPIQTMDRAWDTVFVGTRTGFVLQFECKNNMLIPVSSVKFSDQSILALRAMKEGPRKVLLVAARSENVTIKDAQTGLLLRTLGGPKMTVYTLLYEDGKVYCGTSSHQIHVFDYASGSHVGTHEGGKGAVCLRATGGLLFAGCYDGCVYVYREGEARPFAQIRGPSLMLLSLAIVGTKIIAGYKDRSLYIWKIPLCILQEMIL